MNSKPKSVLQLRTQEKIQHLLLDFFSKGDMVLNGNNFFISVSSVDISPNLRNLKIFLDIANMEEKNKKQVVKHLNENYINTIKSLLAKKVNLRYVPDIYFLLDNSNEKLIKISNLIDDEIKKNKK